MLLFSDLSLNSIRNEVKGKNAYIVPGTISINEMNLSYNLDIPILMEDVELTRAIFTKSGSKRIFELNNMAFPISAWDIRNEEEFYNSIVDLIIKYPYVNIWIFKMNSEVNGRGIAYIQLDKDNIFSDLLKERTSNLIDEDYFKEELKEYIPFVILLIYINIIIL
jgi:hypothetical protein